MFAIYEDKSIHLTRGDAASIAVSAKTGDGQQYAFQAGDIVRFKVFKRKDCMCVLLAKDFKPEEGATEVTVYLDKDDTKIGDVINKPTTYWYEVELNPDTVPQTIIGYDEEGEKTLVLYPEGSDG